MVTINDYDDSWNVAVATVVEGTVNGVIQDERKVRVDGTWYTLANDKTGAKSDDTDLYTVQNSVKEFVNKDAVTLYVVGDIAYYAEATKGNDINRSVLMVYDVQDDKDQWGDKNQIKVIFPTGDKKTVTLADDSAVTIDGDIEVKVGQMYYYMTNNDDEYLLTVLGTDANQEDAGYENVVTDTDGIDGEDSFGKRTIADEAIVFALVGGDDAKVYTGKTIKDAKLTGAATKVKHGQLGQALQETDNGFTYTRMMNIDIAKDTIDTTTAYGYLVTDATYSYNSELGQYVMEYSYWNGKELVDKIEITSSNKKDQMHKHTIIAFAEDGEYIKDVKPAEPNYAALVGYDNGKVSLNNENGYRDGIREENTVADVDADTITFYVDSNATSAEKIGQQGEGWDYVAPIRNGESLINVAYILDNDDKDVKFIVIDVDGQLEGHNTVDTDIDDGDEDTDVVDVLPSYSEKAVIENEALISGVRYLNNKLYVQFNNNTFDGASLISGELMIADSNGATRWVSFDDLAVTEGTHVSKVLEIPYSTSADGALYVSLVNGVAIDEWYVAYVDNTGKALTSDVIANATKTVANKAGEAIEVTIKLPANATEFKPTAALTNITKTAPGTNLNGSVAYTADIAFEGTLTAAGTQPKIVITTATATKYDASITVGNVTNIENGVGYASVPAITELAKGATDPGVDMTVQLTDAPANGDKLVVTYTVNGTEKKLTHIISNTNQPQTVDFNGKIDAVAGKTDIVITKIERYGVLTLPTNRTVTGSGSSNAATYADYVLTIGDTEVTATTGTMDVLYGTKVIVTTTAAAAPASGTDTITVTATGMTGTKTDTVANTASGDDLKVEITLTMQKTTSDFAVAVANA